MKKICFLVLMLMSSIMLINNMIYIVDAQEEDAGLQVTFTTNPTVVAPGTKGYIEVNLKSIGGTSNNIEISATSLSSKVVVRYGEWDDLDIGDLASGASYSVLFQFSVPSTAAPGLYLVRFEIERSGGNDILQNAVVKVEDSTVLDLVSVAPTSVNIGEATTLIFNITNNRGSDIYNILFNWEDPNDLILPIGSDSRITISSIAADNYTELPIVVMASSGISPGVYPLIITMDYYDQTGTEQTITSTVGLQISGTTTFDVVLQTSTSTSTTFAVVNTGANTASSVVVSIPQQPGYSTSGTSSSSLGNLEAGDYTLASFQLSSTSSNMTTQFPSFNRTGTGSTPPGMNFSGGRDRFTNQSFPGMSGSSQLLVQIAYTDLFGVRQTVQKQVALSGSASGFSSRTGTQGTSGMFPGGFSGQSQSSDSSNSLTYISIGVAGIIIIIAVIQLGRKKKLGRFSKLFKGRKE
jgi:hypothetical protein